MKPHHREQIDAIRPVLAEHGVSFDIEEGRGRHVKLVLFVGEERRRFPLTGTPSDRRGLQNFVSQIKRWIRTKV